MFLQVPANRLPDYLRDGGPLLKHIQDKPLPIGGVFFMPANISREIIWRCTMPAKPKRPCAKPGCFKLVEAGYCAKHKQDDKKQRAEAARHYDIYLRDQKSKLFYKSRAWQAARQRVLTRYNYLCQDCLRENRITQADTVHHRVEISKVWSKRLDMDNLVSLCASCHNRRHSVK